MAHPLDHFTHCPACGSSQFEVSSFKSKRCAACGFEYFLNPSAATAAFILNGRGELLVERRREEPARGTLDLPGGFCDIGETVEEGIRREVMEETGLRLTAVRYLFSLPNTYLYSQMTIPTLDLFFQCEAEDIALLHAADDAAEVMWIPIADVQPALFGLASVRKAVEKFLSM